MHPALSVIVFTVASGAGYGMLIIVSALSLLGWSRPVIDQGIAARWHGIAELVVALGMAGLGLFASTFHLGRRERAWRAFSQWRSSWLSREGIVSLATFAPALAFAWVRYTEGVVRGPWQLAPAGCLAGAVATLVCTGMIYASLKPIRQWRDPRVVPAYVALALASGAVMTLLVGWAFGAPPNAALTAFAVAALIGAAAVKLSYWRAIDRGRSASTTASAIGLNEATSARLLDPPHTGTNYLLEEMGFRVARKHALTLRRAALVVGFVLPAILVVVAHAAGALAVAVAVVANLVGTAIERWLFFAEATHTVTLYYGARAV
ncbi:MAG: DmsC/YnfH family molybdoenzyme membrane anchor subunit [Alphaproteobacteria bacterium]